MYRKTESETEAVVMMCRIYRESALPQEKKSGSKIALRLPWKLKRF